MQKAMGLVWDPDLDILKIKVNLDPTPVTKQGILQKTQSNFDPIGFSDPFMLEGKWIYQDASLREGQGWDVPLLKMRIDGLSGYVHYHYTISHYSSMVSSSKYGLEV